MEGMLEISVAEDCIDRNVDVNIEFALGKLQLSIWQQSVPVIVPLVSLAVWVQFLRQPLPKINPDEPIGAGFNLIIRVFKFLLWINSVLTKKKVFRN